MPANAPLPLLPPFSVGLLPSLVTARRLGRADHESQLAAALEAPRWCTGHMDFGSSIITGEYRLPSLRMVKKPFVSVCAG